MHEDVRLQRTNEKECASLWIGLADNAGLHRAAKVIGQNRYPPPGRAVLGRGVERHDERSRFLVHVDGDVCADDCFDEWHKSLSDAAKDLAGIGGRVDVDELQDEIGRRGDAPAHRRAKKIELRFVVAKDGGRRDPKLTGDVRERGRIKSLFAENLSRRFQQLLSGNPRRPSHL